MGGLAPPRCVRLMEHSFLQVHQALLSPGHTQFSCIFGPLHLLLPLPEMHFLFPLGASLSSPLDLFVSFLEGSVNIVAVYSSATA